jgi:transposase
VSELQLDRQVRRRLAVLCQVEEVTGNVAMTCRYFGISRQTYYDWLRRYESEGVDGLRDRSRRPRSSPNATRAEVVEKIIHLRQHYHFGPRKIVMYLQRYHDVTMSVSGVWRILHRLDMGRLPASQRYQRHDRRWKRYEKQRPGHQVPIDVKFVEPLAAVGPRRPTGSQTGRPAREVLPVHRHRRLHPIADHEDLPAQQPEDHHPVRRLHARPAAVRRRGHPDRQRRGVPVGVPLARAGQGHPARLHQTPHPGSTARSNAPTASTPRSSTDAPLTC